VVAEKPSVGQDLVRALGRRGEKFDSHQGFFLGTSRAVTWAVGHLLELCEPEDYDPSWKRWSVKSLPIIPEHFKLRPVAGAERQLEVVLSLLRSPAVGEVVNACDAGREGELIFRQLMEAAGVDLPVRRLWVSAMTSEAILEGLDNLRDGTEFDRLAAAARCRSESDWLVGINATRGMTRRAGLLLAVGRVQTPTLAILAERERRIQAFQPENYWEVRACFEAAAGSYQGVWFDPEVKGKGSHPERLKDADRARALAQKVRGARGEVLEVRREPRTHKPPLLHDLTQLQRDMNRRYGMPASRTLRVAQDLYEKYKVITYPRTDSRFLSRRNVPLLRPTLQAVAAADPELAAAARPLLEAPGLPVSGRQVNDKLVRDHHAIIPTLAAAGGARLKGDHRKVFDAVARRLVAAFYPAAVVENTTVTTEVEGERFRSKGRRVVEQGWFAVEGAPKPRGDNEAQDLPALESGQEVLAARAEAVEKETKPPPRYTEASLLQAMDTAGDLVDDEELQQAMKDRGIGTPATRAAIIERLIEVGYVTREGRTLVPTAKGLGLVSIIPTRDLVSPALTGRWESRLRAVERGDLSREEFMGETKAFTARIVKDVLALKGGETLERMRPVVGRCPRCGSDVAEGPRAFFCRGESCDFYIWKKVAGKDLRAEDAAALLAGRRTRLIRGFRSKKGRRFAAHLVLENGKVSFVFPERKGQAKAVRH